VVADAADDVHAALAQKKALLLQNLYSKLLEVSVGDFKPKALMKTLG
jgi:hypothetical protein